MPSFMQLLKARGVSQRALAKAISLSPASVNLIIKHGQFPKSPSKAQIIARINRALNSQQLGATSQSVQIDVSGYFPDPKQDNPATNNTANPQEQDIMLLKKQRLSMEARQAFRMHQNPFTAEVSSHQGLYQSPDIAYVRAAMHQTAKFGGFIAITGESGSGKSTLRRDLLDRIIRDKEQVIVIEPYILATEDNDIKGKTLKALHIAESIIASLAPLETPKRSSESRFRQVHNLLKESSRAGNSHVIIIEEAHSLPIPTLKHLKRFFELEDGYKKLLSIILIGQNELALKLSEQNAQVREVVQRCELITLQPILPHDLRSYLALRAKQFGASLESIIDSSGIEAIAMRLTQTAQTTSSRSAVSLLYPLAVGNLLTGAINLAAELGAPIVTADVVREA